jgi:hypothetical protein
VHPADPIFDDFKRIVAGSVKKEGRRKMAFISAFLAVDLRH